MMFFVSSISCWQSFIIVWDFNNWALCHRLHQDLHLRKQTNSKSCVLKNHWFLTSRKKHTILLNFLCFSLWVFLKLRNQKILPLLI